MSDKTQVVREFRPEDIRRLKAEASKDIAVAGPTLAAHFIKAGLIDEYAFYCIPVVLGAGNPVFKDIEGRLDLDLVEERRYATGMVFLRYVPRNAGMSA
ncbi:dihydrofolate reductase family protein [Pelagibacterium sp. H642]|uniref:dihydrofolate reductase family protein n=1 Tax=Pelagibacterium sp. H642 TaxID=1881069 RepID=UPI00281527E4|nr:dihydrofolate reductase family protein [Pelagibacterium sp. H642]WMT92677.1 dihydrofolate reductase family protein [Pelagibacterium sp. H642]